jgi:broad specificity phosphatase PhoE
VKALYLIRHGQAGTRRDYDTLSEVGRRQSELLGRYFRTAGVRFERVVCGALARQRETYECVADSGGLPPGEIDPAWNEFDLEGVYRDIAPQLCAADPSFAAEFALMLRQAEDDSHAVHRGWSNCDVRVFRAWFAGTYASSGETWIDFQDRIARALNSVKGIESGGAIAVFTSATPIGVALGLNYGLEAKFRVGFAAALYNTSVTVLQPFGGELGLWTFNSVAHLPDPALHTQR